MLLLLSCVCSNCVLMLLLCVMWIFVLLCMVNRLFVNVRW